MSKHTTISQLKKMAQRTNQEIDKFDAKVTALSGRVDELVTTGGEPNVITSINVNGTAQTITDKAVDITVPTKVSEITNDSNFQTDTEVAAAVAAADHLKRQKVTSVADIDPFAEGADKLIYMVPKTGSDADDVYDEYMVIDGKVEHVGNTKVDLSGYQLKEEGKVLSSNDYTDEEKAKLAGIDVATDAEFDAMLTEVFGAETPAEPTA